MGTFNANVNGAVIDETLQRAKRVETKKADFDVKNYLNTKLKDGEDERSIAIRILPVSNEDGNFAIAVKTHGLKVSKRIANNGFKSFLCLNDPQIPNYDKNVKCPICEKAQYYFDEAKKVRQTDEEKSKKLFKKACSLKSKTTYILRVIERGKENEGVKFWRFNENTQHKGIYDALMALYVQRKKDMEEEGISGYNIFDLDNGRDIIISLKRTVRSDGKEGTAIQITDKSINKPLTNDVELGNSWINDVKRWYNAYTVKSPEYLEIIADDKIPYYDKNIGKFVPKTEQDFIDAERHMKERQQSNEAAKEAASELLKEKKSTKSSEMPYIVNADDNEDMDLPF